MLPTAIVGDAGLVADAVGERRLEQAAVDRAAASGDGLPGGDVDDVAAVRLAAARATLDRVVRRRCRPAAQSVAEMRTEIGLSAGQAARTASKTSSGKRMRFSSEPPYSSVRWLVSGERKLASR